MLPASNEMIEKARDTFNAYDGFILSKVFSDDLMMYINFYHIDTIRRYDPANTAREPKLISLASGQVYFPTTHEVVNFVDRKIYWFGKECKWYLDSIGPDNTTLFKLVEIDIDFNSLEND